MHTSETQTSQPTSDLSVQTDVPDLNEGSTQTHHGLPKGEVHINMELLVDIELITYLMYHLSNAQRWVIFAHSLCVLRWMHTDCASYF